MPTSKVTMAIASNPVFLTVKTRKIPTFQEEWLRTAHPRSFVIKLQQPDVTRLPTQPAVVEDVVAREGRALGGSGRARGLLDVDRVMWVEGRLARAQGSLVAARALGQECVPVVLEYDDRAQLGESARTRARIAT
jgi:hypothetical protein